MNGIPLPEQLAALVAESRAQCAGGPPPAIARPVVVDEQGYAYGVCPDDPECNVGSYVHAGVRVGWVPMAVQGGLLVSIWGGLTPEPGFEEEGVTAFLTADGVRRLAADLVAIADAAAFQQEPR